MLSDLFFRPALSKEAAGPELKKPKISFKKFNKFNRPDIRKTLLEKILKKGGGKNTVEESSEEKVIYLAIHCTVQENPINETYIIDAKSLLVLLIPFFYCTDDFELAAECGCG